MFHVKQFLEAGIVYRLFSDAEIPENDIQNVLDIDPSGQAAQGAGGQAQIFGHQLRLSSLQSAHPQGVSCVLKQRFLPNSTNRPASVCPKYSSA